LGKDSLGCFFGQIGWIAMLTQDPTRHDADVGSSTFGIQLRRLERPLH